MNFNMDFALADEIKAALSAVVDSRQYIAGEQLRRFETRWANYNGVRHAVGVGSGTDAIALSLQALGVGPGDEVITPAFNAAYAAQAVTSIGATNIFVDVNPETLLLEAESILPAMTDRTRAVIPVHLFGQMCNMTDIVDSARWWGLVVVEDAAQAHGALFNGMSPGTWSDAAAFSHYPTKNLGSLGEAGSVITRLPVVAQQIRLLRDCGRTDRYVHVLAGRNSMLDEIQAAVLNVKLSTLDSQNRKRALLADRYRLHLAGVADIRFTRIADAAVSVNHLFPIRTNQRRGLMIHLKGAGIPTLSHYPCVMTRQPFAVAETLDARAYPHAEKAAREVMSLPLWPDMTEAQQDEVIAAVKGYFS